MSVRRHQIVDRLPIDGDDSPVVLFDFDQWFTLAVGTDFSPPGVRSTSTWTQLNDGETPSASTLGDRVLSLVLDQFRGNAEDQAEVLQLLARLLDDSRGQWFLWRDEGTVHERYFRTRRTSLSIQDFHLLEKPKRTVTVSIPAEPYAQGELVETSYVVTNDPTTGPNPMVIEIEDVKGDVPTPVWMSVDYAGTAFNPRNLIVAGSAATPDVDGGVVLFDAGAFVGPSTGFTRTVVADATAIGGSLVRFTNTTGLLTEVQTVSTVYPVERGDYRILVRTRTLVPGGVGVPNVWVWPGVGGNIDVPAADNPNEFRAVTTWEWLDLGIARMPGGAPLASDRAETDLTYPMIATIGMRIRLAGAGSPSLDVDTIMLVPAGLDRAVLGTMLRTMQDPSMVGTQAWIDGINDTTYLVADDPGTSTTLIEPLISDGDTPYLVPGVLNRLFVVPYVRNPDDLGPDADDKTETVTVTVKHRAQYLYLRSATG